MPPGRAGPAEPVPPGRLRHRRPAFQTARAEIQRADAGQPFGIDPGHDPAAAARSEQFCIALDRVGMIVVHVLDDVAFCSSQRLVAGRIEQDTGCLQPMYAPETSNQMGALDLYLEQPKPAKPA